MANSGVADCWLGTHAEKYHLTNLEPWVNRQGLELTGVL
jgi:hypothetical protein